MAQQVPVKKKDDMGVAQAVQELARKDVVRLEGAGVEGKEVEIRVCKVRDIPNFTRFVAILFMELKVSIENLDNLEEAVKEKFSNGAEILKLISNHFGDVSSLLSTLTNLTKEEVEDLDLDDAVAVVRKVIEINYDFFTRKVFPLLPGVLAQSIASAALSPGKT